MEAVELIISPTFVESLIAVAVLLYNNVLVFCLPAYSCQLFLCLVFNFRSCRPSWQPRNCLKDWRSLWGATLLTVVPWLPTERFTMKEHSSPQRKTDPGGPAGETSVTLALRERGFGPCDQDPSDRIFTPRATILQRGKGSFAWCEGIVGIPDSAQEIEWQVEKLAYLIVIQSVVGSVVSASCRNNNTFRWLRRLSAKFETCVMWESVSCQHA